MKNRPIFLRALVMSFWDNLPKVRRIRNEISKRLSADSVLEVGCGFGANSRFVRGPYLGIDNDPQVLQAARLRNPNKNFALMNARKLELEPGRFDAVLFCLFVHEHTWREEALAQAARLAPKRILVFDYEPVMRAWPRFHVSLIESPGIEHYFEFDLSAFMSTLGWNQTGGENINSLFRWWEFQKAV